MRLYKDIENRTLIFSSPWSTNFRQFRRVSTPKLSQTRLIRLCLYGTQMWQYSGAKQNKSTRDHHLHNFTEKWKAYSIKENLRTQEQE